jgi:hypothetical protein
MMLHCASLIFKDERGQEIRIKAALDNAFEVLVKENDLISPALP